MYYSAKVMAGSWRKVTLVSFLLLYLIFPVFSQQISIDKLKKDVYLLASDSLKGRKPGTPESQMAAMYIRKQFELAGLNLLAARGFQKFDMIHDVKLGKLTAFSFPGFEGKPGVDFTPLSFSENGRLDASGAFAGYGFSIQEDSLHWNDYAGIDVKGRWVMILRGDPEPDKSDSRFIPYGDARGKVLRAKDKGAIGVIFVTGPGLDKKDTLVSLQYDKSGATAGIPVLHVNRKVADLMLAGSGKNIAQLEEGLRQNRGPASFLLPVRVKATIQVAMQRAMTENVLGVIEGSDPLLKKEYVVIGAHYDHLGMGGHGSGSRVPDTVAVHFGADDNASGVAGIIALAELLAASEEKPRRSLLFVAFAAEESGLLGSRYFVKNPPVGLDSIVAMFNFDMIGRLASDSANLMISGTGTAVETMDLINKHAANLPFQLKFSPEGYGASDHSSFYTENIPVFFFTTGAHDDYHTPFDTPEKLNYEGQKQVLDFSAKLIREVADSDSRLSFREAGPKGMQSRGGRFKVVLGILPDFTGSDNKGLRVDGVNKDGPAGKGGLLKGDIITAMNGKEVRNIYEYMDRLKTYEHGQTVIIDLLRGGKKIVLLVQL